MRLIASFIFSIFSNALALYLAATFIPGFSVADGLVAFATAGAILAVLNAFLKPLMKIFLGPFIILTLGLFAIVINAVTLYLLDLLSEAVTISGYLPLLEATLLVSAVNFVLGIARKKT